MYCTAGEPHGCTRRQQRSASISPEASPPADALIDRRGPPARGLRRLAASDSSQRPGSRRTADGAHRKLRRAAASPAASARRALRAQRAARSRQAGRRPQSRHAAKLVGASRQLRRAEAELGGEIGAVIGPPGSGPGGKPSAASTPARPGRRARCRSRCRLAAGRRRPIRVSAQLRPKRCAAPLTLSDNEAAAALFADLERTHGGIGGASAAVGEVLREAG